jgi:methionyl-tRNA formyltransferase
MEFISNDYSRLVFMGTPGFARPCLKKLLDHNERVLAVFTQPDRPKGRGQRLAHSPIKEIALAYGLPLVQPKSFKDPVVRESLSAYRPDLLIVVAYGLILPQAVLDIPAWGSINVHASLLPKFRGAAPIQWALISGEKETGITTMRLDAGLDTGDLLLQETTPISPTDTAQTLHDRLADLGADLLVKTLQSLRSGTLEARPQNPKQASYAPPLKKSQGRIDWRLSAPELDFLIRGLTPWPGAFTFLQGKRLIIHRAQPLEGKASGEPGTIGSFQNTQIQVLTGQGTLSLLEVQLEGHRRLNSQDFLIGFPLRVGEKLGP